MWQIHRLDTAPLFPAVGVPRQGRKGFPSNFPRSGGDGGLPAFTACDLDELVTDHPRFPLQIRQHPVTVWLCIGLLARIHLGRAIAQPAIDEPRQLMCGRCHRFRRAHPRPPPTVRGPSGAMPIDHAVGRSS